MLNKFLFIYLNDILISSETEEEHIQHVHLFLRRLLENSFLVKVKKNEIHVTTVAFLGFIVQQVLPDHTKIQAVAEITPHPPTHLPVRVVDWKPVYTVRGVRGVAGKRSPE